VTPAVERAPILAMLGRRQDAFPEEAARDLLGLVRALYSARKAAGAGLPELQRIARVGAELADAIALAHESRPDTVGARAAAQMLPGEPVFFRLKSPERANVGYGFFAQFAVVDLDEAWALFGWKNGDPDKLRFLQRIGGYRHVDLLTTVAARAPIGCKVLREARFWPRSRWIPWGDTADWAPNIVQGRTETDAGRVALLMAAMANDERHAPEDLGDRFVLVDTDERAVVLAETQRREGQRTFRLRMLKAYDGRCAITGEHTEPVLDEAGTLAFAIIDATTLSEFAGPDDSGPTSITVMAFDTTQERAVYLHERGLDRFQLRRNFDAT
jgi:hypothetical protein